MIIPSAHDHDMTYTILIIPQSCHEFVHCNCLHPHVTLNSAVWMAAINMAKDAKVTGKSFKDFQ